MYQVETAAGAARDHGYDKGANQATIPLSGSLAATIKTLEETRTRLADALINLRGSRPSPVDSTKAPAGPVNMTDMSAGAAVLANEVNRLATELYERLAI